MTAFWVCAEDEVKRGNVKIRFYGVNDFGQCIFDAFNINLCV